MMMTMIDDDDIYIYIYIGWINPMERFTKMFESSRFMQTGLFSITNGTIGPHGDVL